MMLQSLLAQLRAFLSNATDVALLVNLLDRLVPAKLRPFAKAVLPALLSLVAFLVLALSTGRVDGAALNTLVVGLLGSIVTYLIPNTSKPVPAPEQAPPAQ